MGQRAEYHYHKILLLLLARKMLGLSTEENFLHLSLNVHTQEIDRTILRLIKEDMISKITYDNTVFYELTEKGINIGSVELSDLFGKMLIWFK